MFICLILTPISMVMSVTTIGIPSLKSFIEKVNNGSQTLFTGMTITLILFIGIGLYMGENYLNQQRS
jgi:hypothetical protein